MSWIAKTGSCLMLFVPLKGFMPALMVVDLYWVWMWLKDFFFPLISFDFVVLGLRLWNLSWIRLDYMALGQKENPNGDRRFWSTFPCTTQYFWPIATYHPLCICWCRVEATAAMNDRFKVLVRSAIPLLVFFFQSLLCLVSLNHLLSYCLLRLFLLIHVFCPPLCWCFLYFF